MDKATPKISFLRPDFVDAARARFDALRKEHPDIRSVDAVLADICGVLRGKRLPLEGTAHLFETGMQIPQSIYLMDASGEMVNPFGRGIGDGDPDGTAWPIPETISLVWNANAKRAQMLMTLRDERGNAHPAEPRSVLERVLARFKELKLTPVAALELEFYLIDRERGEGGRPQPPLDPRSGNRERYNSVYGIDDLDRYRSFLDALDEAAATQGIPVSATSSEYAPGQFEANLRHQPDAMMAADHAVFLKQVVKAAALASGFDATFMAKPYPDRAGTGLHVHVSLVDGKGRNVFDDGTAAGSDLLRHAIGGMQALMPGSMALFAPSVNSYRRFQPDMFAPVNRRWGVNNRSAGLRIPMGPGEARRIEHRAAGADANPYLMLAAVLAGLHHGLENRLDPGPAAVGNVSREPDTTLPFSLDDALDRLAGDKVLASYLGEETVALYAETKRLEARRFARIISRAEYEWYL
ncbi:MAG TPA: glutamine synthetase family protein [Rhizomicrobium sp.]|jgi:glutamine synthetase|nr:glutamine synthetase family protein [Rhizomicrobium sp.]